jgi:flagellar biosynthesis chaperone FliJ
MFRLEKVLRWKTSLEKEARLRRTLLERRARELERRIEESRQGRQSLPDDVHGIQEIMEWSRALERMRRTEERLAERLHELQPALAERIRMHLELRRDVKGLEKLAEKDQRRIRESRERRAQERMDDAAGRRSLPRAGRDFPACKPEAERAPAQRATSAAERSVK